MAAEKVEKPPLQVHLEPDSPIELDELTGALNAIAHQYRLFAKEQGLIERAADARLLVSSVKPGSIDIGLTPSEVVAAAQGAVAVAATLGSGLAGQIEIATGFVARLNELLNFFKTPDKDPDRVSVTDCSDVIAITAPITNHGGHQTINIFKGDVYVPVVQLNAENARAISQGAYEVRARKQFPEGERREHVALVWQRIDDEEARTTGKSSPDKATIEDLDPRPKRVFFDADVAYLKNEMLSGVPNPFQRVYFVDVEVSRVDGRIASYRVTAFHGSEDVRSIAETAEGAL